MGARSFYVYILANRIGGTLYIGVTNDLIRRVYEHKSGAAESFTKRHDVNRLVYFECFDDIEAAIHREKRLKKWTRAWKIALMKKTIRIGLIFILRSPGEGGRLAFSYAASLRLHNLIAVGYMNDEQPMLPSSAKAGDPVFQRPSRKPERLRRTGSPGQAGR